MTRPMPKAARWALVQQYTGRRRTLAQAVHEHLSFYESHPGYGIAWDGWTRDTASLTVRSPMQTLDPMPQCFCEEDWMIDLLWVMVSDAAMRPEEAPDAPPL
jgi:hypothetical protein